MRTERNGGLQFSSARGVIAMTSDIVRLFQVFSVKPFSCQTVTVHLLLVKTMLLTNQPSTKQCQFHSEHASNEYET